MRYTIVATFWIDNEVKHVHLHSIHKECVTVLGLFAVD